MTAMGRPAIRLAAALENLRGRSPAGEGVDAGVRPVAYHAPPLQIGGDADQCHQFCLCLLDDSLRNDAGHQAQHVASQRSFVLVGGVDVRPLGQQWRQRHHLN